MSLMFICSNWCYDWCYWR